MNALIQILEIRSISQASQTVPSPPGRHSLTPDWLPPLVFHQSQSRSGSGRYITSMAERRAGIPG